MREDDGSFLVEVEGVSGCATPRSIAHGGGHWVHHVVQFHIGPFRQFVACVVEEVGDGRSKVLGC